MFFNNLHLRCFKTQITNKERKLAPVFSSIIASIIAFTHVVFFFLVATRLIFILKIEEKQKVKKWANCFSYRKTRISLSGVAFDNATEGFTARYEHETVALAFALTEEAVEDNLYDRLGSRYTKALAPNNPNKRRAQKLLMQGKVEFRSYSKKMNSGNT